MASKFKNVTIRLCTMNARTGNSILPYVELFSRISGLESSDTIRPMVGGVNFAIELSEVTLRKDGARSDGQQLYAGRVVVGAPDDVPLYFDTQTGATELGETPEGKWLAQVARIVISIGSEDRYIAIESNKSGVTAPRLARYFEMLAGEAFKNDNIQLEIIPLQSLSLKDDIEAFERIRLATATVTRPNFDWSDMSNKLSTLADESSAHEAEATVRAARGESLEKNSGIVSAILQTVNTQASAAMSKFKIIGRMQGSDKDATVTSEKHQQRATVRIPRTATARDVDEIVFEGGGALIAARRDLDQTIVEHDLHE